MAARHDPSDVQAELLEVSPVEPGPALRRRILAATEEATRLAGFVSRFARLFDLDETAAADVLDGARTPASAAWQDAPLPGVRLLHFPGGPRVAAADCGLVRLEPGTRFPAHRHRGAEWTFVLAGSAEEDGGERWLPGDLVVREAGSQHAFRAVGDEPYLFAVVLHDAIELIREG